MDNFISPVKFLEYVRDGLVEQEHFGLFVKVGENVFKVGEDLDYPFYLRSCAKPLQASLLIDYGLVETYNMSSEEIALCCASHAGEPYHVKIGRRLLGKIGLDESCLKCGLHRPISKHEQEKLLLFGQSENVFQNNCSGKHIMMLGICKKMEWDLNTYDDINHPLQVAIKNKIYELCELKKEYPVTKDGCGVPINSMPLENMCRGYLNLFFDEKYSKIREAFVDYSYIIGGEDRLDTAIMTVNKNLIAKVGAGGLCMVVNLEQKEALIVKIMDCDMKARAVSLIAGLHQLGWLDDEMMKIPLILAQNITEIKTLHGEKVGFVKTMFNFVK